MYKAITKKQRLEIQKVLYDAVMHHSWKDKKEKNGEYFVFYVILQDLKFITEMKDDELKEIIRITVDILEELKKINNKGIDKENFNNLFKQHIKDESSITGYFGLWLEVFRTKKMDDLFAEIDLIKKVGGAYAAILVHPKLLHTIVSVYEVLVDKFDNEDTYLTCAYFLLRGIMHIDSKEDK